MYSKSKTYSNENVVNDLTLCLKGMSLYEFKSLSQLDLIMAKNNN